MSDAPRQPSRHDDAPRQSQESYNSEHKSVLMKLSEKTYIQMGLVLTFVAGAFGMGMFFRSVTANQDEMLRMYKAQSEDQRRYQESQKEVNKSLELIIQNLLESNHKMDLRLTRLEVLDGVKPK